MHLNRMPRNIITNNFHVFRGMTIAKHTGFKNVAHNITPLLTLHIKKYIINKVIFILLYFQKKHNSNGAIYEKSFRY